VILPNGEVFRQFTYHDKQLPPSLISHELDEHGSQLFHYLMGTDSHMYLCQDHDGLSYCCYKFGDINVLLVSDWKDELQKLTYEIGWNLLRIIDLEAKNDELITDQIQERITEILKSYVGNQISTFGKPAQYLSPAAILQLPVEYQKIAIVLLSLQEASLITLCQETGESEVKVQQALNLMLNQNYITSIKRENEEFYTV